MACRPLCPWSVRCPVLLSTHLHSMENWLCRHVHLVNQHQAVKNEITLPSQLMRDSRALLCGNHHHGAALVPGCWKSAVCHSLSLSVTVNNTECHAHNCALCNRQTTTPDPGLAKCALSLHNIMQLSSVLKEHTFQDWSWDGCNFEQKVQRRPFDPVKQQP